MKIIVKSDDDVVLETFEDEMLDGDILDALDTGSDTTAARRKKILYQLEPTIDRALNKLSPPEKRTCRIKKSSRLPKNFNNIP